MLNIFAASVLFAAVQAKGTGDGSSMQNAAEVELIPGKLKLFTYNENNAGIDMLHGSLQYGRTANVDENKIEFRRYVEYGACISLKNIYAQWDCMQVRTTWDYNTVVNDPNNPHRFTIKDKYFRGIPPL